MRPAVLPSVALAAALVSAAPCAAAQDKQACVRASDRGQELRDSGKLRAARQELVACARPACPAIVRAFCAQRVEDVDRAVPSVVVRARDAAGADVVDVRVTVDGAVVTTKLDGNPLPMDPGEHTFRYELAGSAPIEQKVMLRTGEKHRALDVSFAVPPRPVAVAPAAASEGASSALPARQRPVPLASVILAATGAVAVGASAFFVLSARGDAEELRGRCAPACDDAELDGARTKLLLANVSAIAGAAALATAVVLYVTRPDARPDTRATFGAAPVAGGAAAMVRLRF